MCSSDRNVPMRGFWTPPVYWEPRRMDFPATAATERRRFWLINGGDRFRITAKVPPSDSPYGRAKHVQIMEKDPTRAISLFWAAINEGDRIDSALKDMAALMKQLNRADEAIEAIRSFRHLCDEESQDSLDNILVELYKGTGRIEEEIEVLQFKLKNIEEILAFGWKRTKAARSQGKKALISIQQEKSRVQGNLAWAHLRLHNYGLAEKYYREALSVEPDKNKQCNLAICLIRMSRIEEAKSLLQSIRNSTMDQTADESHSKSFGRALEMLTEIESRKGEKSSTMKENQNPVANISPESLITQPRRCSLESNNRNFGEGKIIGSSVRKLSFDKCNEEREKTFY